MKQFYVLQGQTKRMHPLVKIEDVLIIDVPRAGNYEITSIGEKLIPLSPKVSLPLLPVFDYETEMVKVIVSPLLISAILKEEKDFLRHDYIITGVTVGLYTIEVVETPLNPGWQVPTDEELKQYGEEYQQRKIEKIKELNHGK